MSTEVTFDGDAVDEIVGTANIHFERLTDDAAMLRVGGWHFTLVAKRGKLVVLVVDREPANPAERKADAQ